MRNQKTKLNNLSEVRRLEVVKCVFLLRRSLDLELGMVEYAYLKIFLYHPKFERLLHFVVQASLIHLQDYLHPFFHYSCPQLEK